MATGISITGEGKTLYTAGKYCPEDINVAIDSSIKLPVQTYNPSTTDQVIPAGKYLAGAQTVKGDANLIAGNIKQGVSIFGVNGDLPPGIVPVEINAISVLNDVSIYGTQSGIVLDILQKDIRTIKVVFKQLTSQTNDMLIASCSNDGVTSAPWISSLSNGGWNSCVMETRAIEDYTELTATVYSSSGLNLRFGNWTDATYSTSNAFKSIKLYDTNNVLIRDIISVTVGGLPMFLDRISGKVYGCTNPLAILPGEAVV